MKFKRMEVSGWTEYVTAAEEMFERTHMKQAPWIIVEANNKKYARTVVLKRILEHIMQVCIEKGYPLQNYRTMFRKAKKHDIIA